MERVMPAQTVLFHEAQSLRHAHIGLILAAPPCALLFITLRQVVWHHPWGSPAISNGGLIFLTVLLAAVYLRLMTVKLVTDLLPAEILVAMRGLWRRTRIPIDRIRNAAPVEYDPVSDFGGYGVRSGRKGTAYIARGNRAVRLELADGRTVLIGSQNADLLARRIGELRKESSR
jgi:hypothetical protein